MPFNNLNKKKDMSGDANTFSLNFMPKQTFLVFTIPYV